MIKCFIYLARPAPSLLSVNVSTNISTSFRICNYLSISTDDSAHLRVELFLRLKFFIGKVFKKKHCTLVRILQNSMVLDELAIENTDAE